jgi:hypothetical protein
VITGYTLVIHLPVVIPSLYIIVKESLVDDVEIARRYYKKGYKLPDLIESQLENEDLATNAEARDKQVDSRLAELEQQGRLDEMKKEAEEKIRKAQDKAR